MEKKFKKAKKPTLIQELLKTTHHQKTMASQPFYLRQMKMLSFVSQFVACIMTLLVVSLPNKYSTDRHWYHSQVDTMFFSDLVTLAFLCFIRLRWMKSGKELFRFERYFIFSTSLFFGFDNHVV